MTASMIDSQIFCHHFCTEPMRATLAGFRNPANYVGLAGEMVDRVLALEGKQ